MIPQITSAQALEQVCELIQAVTGIESTSIRVEDRLMNDLQMDSVELIDLLIKLEEIDVKLSESQISSHITVGDIAKFVESQSITINLEKNG